MWCKRTGEKNVAPNCLRHLWTSQLSSEHQHEHQSQHLNIQYMLSLVPLLDLIGRTVAFPAATSPGLSQLVTGCSHAMPLRRTEDPQAAIVD